MNKLYDIEDILIRNDFSKGDLMFSTSQLDLIDNFVKSMYNNGYEYYFVHSNTNANSYNSYDFADLTFYFSKQPINVLSSDGYILSSDNIILQYDVISRNVSLTSTQDNRVPRFNDELLTVMTSVTVPSYEFIMTNCLDNSMDCLALVDYDNNNNISYNIKSNDFYTIPVLLCVSILITWLSMWFGKSYRRKKRK